MDAALNPAKNELAQAIADAAEAGDIERQTELERQAVEQTDNQTQLGDPLEQP